MMDPSNSKITGQQLPSEHEVPVITGQLPSEHEMPVAGVEIQSVKTEKRTSPKVKVVSPEIKALCLVPLQDGWTREVRLRRTTELRAADIYYYAPDGTRFRSGSEVDKYLKKNSITKYNIKNFSFSPGPFGGDCAPYEVVRMCQAGWSWPKCTNDKNDNKTLMTVLPTNETEEEAGEPVVSTPSTKWKHRDPLKPITHINPNDKLYCICTDVERGQMVKCRNEGCAIKLYHLECIVLSQVPKESQLWYCPICRDSSPETLNPAYAV